MTADGWVLTEERADLAAMRDLFDFLALEATAGTLPVAARRRPRTATGPRRRRELEEGELGWRDVLRANADFPGAYLRFLRRMGIPE